MLNGDLVHRMTAHTSEANGTTMFESRDRILDQLRAGEDGRAKFKEVRFGNRGVVSPNTEELAGELVAFANAEGGVVFLGVDDSGAVRGIPPALIDAVEHWVLNVATHNCDPPIRPILRKALLPGDGGDDRRVLMAEVPRGLYVHRTSGGRYYARLVSTKAGQLHSGNRHHYPCPNPLRNLSRIPPTVEDPGDRQPPRPHGAAHAAQQHGAEESRVRALREKTAEHLRLGIGVFEEGRQHDRILRPTHHAAGPPPRSGTAHPSRGRWCFRDVRACAG